MEKEKGVITEEINMYEDLPNRHVQDLIMELLYGDQPAGWNIAGQKQNILDMKRDDFVSYKKGEKISFSVIKNKLKLPIIIKPANAGSSVGINKVSNINEFNKAIEEAFLFDSKIIIEKFIENKREIECAVLGNSNPKASVCGEVITDSRHKFYSYEAKYIDEKGAKLEIPARISKSLQKKIQDLAIKTFKVLELEGMARVDFFIDNKGKIYVNEVNTIPGFTNISMYPALWKASGLAYSKLIDELVLLAIERFKKEQKLKTSYND